MTDPSDETPTSWPPKSSRPDVPLEVQFPPPPGPPPQQQPSSLSAQFGATSLHDEKEVYDPTSQQQSISAASSDQPVRSGQPASISNDPSTAGQAPYFPPPPVGSPSAAPGAKASTSEQPEMAEVGAMRPAREEKSLPPSSSNQAPPSATTLGAPLIKQQEHELHQHQHQHEHDEDHEVPPPYSLEDEGLYGPPMPPRPHSKQAEHPTAGLSGAAQAVPSTPNNNPTVEMQPSTQSSEAPPPALPPRPPTRITEEFHDDDASNPVHYIRDPHRLIGYLVPFPKPVIKGVDASKIPTRFLIYTPPPPPLKAPPEGEKESRVAKIQRKWEGEVRQAKQSDAKLASWKGVKSRATKGISWAMGAVKSAELEFLNRVPNAPSNPAKVPQRSPRSSTDGQVHDSHSNDGQEGNDHRTVGLEALDLIYPPSLAQGIPGGEAALRAEFINTMMRTRSKAQKDAVIATGLLPVSAAIDILATLIWPFGGLLEVDAVWAYASIRGAKVSRSVTKRLASSTHSDTNLDEQHQSQQQQDSKETLALHFVPSSRLEVLRRYLAARCVERDSRMFASARETSTPPTESSVLSAIGWEPSTSAGETRNWEDEQWERQEVKEDLKMIMTKAARSWDKWCKSFESNPEKALKK